MPLIGGLAAVVLFIETSGRLLAGSPADWIYSGGVFGVPVLLFLALASLSVGLGLLSKRFPQRVLFLSLLLVGVLLSILTSFGPRAASLYYLGTFFVTVSVGGAVSSMSQLAWAQQLLGLLGRSALLVFIAHRLVLQMVGWTLRRADMGPSEGSVVPLIALVTALMAGLCWAKESVLPLRRRLEALGL
jgi:hypothetical protein